MNMLLILLLSEIYILMIMLLILLLSEIYLLLFISLDDWFHNLLTFGCV